jgi:MFS family permease
MVQPVDGFLEDAHEATPLLSSPPGAHNGPIEAASSRRTRCSRLWVYVVAHCIAIAVTADIGEYLFLAPKVRLFESIICTDYYLREDPSLVKGDGSVPERFCKVDPVQDQVAMILGWQLFFDSIPAILLPIPYGYLADTYGRKWITVLSMLGYALSWASTFFIVR